MKVAILFMFREFWRPLKYRIRSLKQMTLCKVNQDVKHANMLAKCTLCKGCAWNNRYSGQEEATLCIRS